MQHIVAQIQRVGGLIQSLSAAACEQQSGMAQVGEAVALIDQVTQQNAALVEQSAAAAESLRIQAAVLVQSISVFHVSPGQGGDFQLRQISA